MAITSTTVMVPSLPMKAVLLILKSDFIYGYPIFKQVAEILQWWEDTKVWASNGNKTTCPTHATAHRLNKNNDYYYVH